MHIKQLIHNAAQKIESDSAQLDAELILLHVIKANRTVLFTDPDRRLTTQESLDFDLLVERRCQGEPIAYLIGNQGFWSLDLEVSPDTLIPRPDTESLVEWVLDQFDHQAMRVLDLGTGTGAIALALAQERPNWHVTGVDFKTEAVALATRNAKRNGIHNAEFFVSDWYSAIPANTNYDLIVSNPPYIDEQDKHLNEGDVRFEPKSALVAADQGLADLAKISQGASAFLKGCLVMEHGWKQAEAVRNMLMKDAFKNVGSGRDLAGHERFTFGSK